MATNPPCVHVGGKSHHQLVATRSEAGDGISDPVLRDLRAANLRRGVMEGWSGLGELVRDFIARGERERQLAGSRLDAGAESREGRRGRQAGAR